MSMSEPLEDGAPNSILSIARYGEVLAHVVHFPRERRAEVLARLDIREADWLAWDARWRAELAAGVAREETTLNASLGAAFAPVRARLRADSPALEDIGPLPAWARGESVATTPTAHGDRGSAQAEPKPAHEVVTGAPTDPGADDGLATTGAPGPSISAPVVAEVPEVPSFMQAPPRQAFRVPDGPVVATPMAASSPAARPFTAETAAIDVSEILKAAVPFDPRAAPATRAGIASARPAERARSSSSTETTAVDVAKILGKATPFAAGSASDQVPALQAEQVSRTASGYGETQEFNMAAILKRAPAMPFAGPGQAAPPRGAPSGGDPAAPAGGENAPPAAPTRRLIRFDPQTGQPLAQPYWQDLGSPEQK